MHKIGWLISGFAFVFAGCSGANWTNAGYLYRYAFWGIPHLISPSNDYTLFPSRPIATAPPAFAFATGPAGTMPATVEYRDGDSVKQVELDSLLDTTDTHAFIVIKDDQLLYEKYFNGSQRDSICMSRSVAKSFTSALVGIAIDEGAIRSVDDPITHYLPELTGRGFDQITIRNLLTMGSGIKFRLADLPWDEEPVAYMHPNLRAVLLNGLVAVEPPGESFHYNDYNTLLLGLVIERATHRTPSEYLEAKIWKPLGMEYPATWSIDSEQDGLELTHVALNARAIDFAKFGRLYLDDGTWNGTPVVSRAWVIESTTRDPNDNRPWQTYSPWRTIDGYYKYFWWGVTRPKGDYYFAAFGLWGQFIFVFPTQRMVIVRTAGNWSPGPTAWAQIVESIVDHSVRPTSQSTGG